MPKTEQKWVFTNQYATMVDRHDIEFNPRSMKSKLCEVIKKELKNFPEYCIDQFTAECGKDIIVKRSPPYHFEPNYNVLVTSQEWNLQTSPQKQEIY